MEKLEILKKELLEFLNDRYKDYGQLTKELYFKDLDLKDLNLSDLSELYKFINKLNPEMDTYESVKRFLDKKSKLLKKLNEMYCEIKNFTSREEYFYDLQGVKRRII